MGNQTRPKTKLDLNELRKNIVEFIQKNSHSEIPAIYRDEENKPVGARVYNFRRKYHQGELDQKTMKALMKLKAGIGNQTRPKTKLDLNELRKNIVEFIQKNSHSEISAHYRDEENKPVGIRVYNFRRKYHQGKLDQKTIESFNEIEEVGIGKSKRRTRGKLKFTEQIHLIKRYQSEFGNLKVKLDEEVYE